MHFAEVTLSGAEGFGLKSVDGPRSSSLKSLRFRISNQKIVSLTLYCSAVRLNCVSCEVKFTLDTNICQIYKGKRVCVCERAGLGRGEKGKWHGEGGGCASVLYRS